MTFDDDFVQLTTPGGTYRLPLCKIGMAWPPPEFIEIDGGPFENPLFRRISLSTITDDERSDMTHICRGAEYVPSTQ